MVSQLGKKKPAVIPGKAILHILCCPVLKGENALTDSKKITAVLSCRTLVLVIIVIPEVKLVLSSILVLYWCLSTSDVLNIVLLNSTTKFSD